MKRKKLTREEIVDYAMKVGRQPTTYTITVTNNEGYLIEKVADKNGYLNTEAFMRDVVFRVCNEFFGQVVLERTNE